MSKYEEQLLKDNKSLDVINGFRKSMGLNKIKPKKRHCLKCTKLFYSEGVNNRLCYSCKN